MSRFKIIVFLMAVAVLSGILATAWWFYIRVIAPDANIQTEISAMKGKGAALPDPGIKRFDRAVEQIESNDFDEARTALYDLVRIFPESTRVTEAKRIIGEINMDMLFSVGQNPLKKDYIVQPGDSLGLIARKQNTTIECILRANGLQSGMLQPGDHLMVFPLDFELVVDVSAKTVTLLRNQRFFREYLALDVKLPHGAKVPFETKISDKAAWVKGKRVSSLSAEFISADKWLVGEKSNFNIRSLPKAKPVDAVQVAPPEAKGKSSSKGKAKGEVAAGSSVDEDDVDVTASIPVTGVFLPREDIEELFTIIRTQTPLKVVR